MSDNPNELADAAEARAFDLFTSMAAATGAMDEWQRAGHVSHKLETHARAWRLWRDTAAAIEFAIENAGDNTERERMRRHLFYAWDQIEVLHDAARKYLNRWSVGDA